MTEAAEVETMLSPDSTLVERRPGRLARAMAGAWHVPAGAVFLVRHVKLWLLALLPTLVGTAALIAGAFAAVFMLHTVEQRLAPTPGQWPAWLSAVATITLWGSTLLSGLVVGLALAVLLTAPLLDRISRWTERLQLPSAPGLGLSAWTIRTPLRSALIMAATMPVFVLLGLVPVVGWLLALVWGAYAVAYQQTESLLSRRHVDAPGRRQWRREWRYELLGFGFAALVLLMIPGLNLLVAPVLAVGATRLWLELHDGTFPDEELSDEAVPDEAVSDEAAPGEELYGDEEPRDDDIQGEEPPGEPS
jgi:uncharacterized protein involved in cysteine biosynthesis